MIFHDQGKKVFTLQSLPPVKESKAGSSPEIFDTLISGNQSTSGAGMYNAASSPVLTNVTFSGNRAFDSGSAIQNFAASSPVIRNSIAWQNAPAGIAVISGPSSLPLAGRSLDLIQRHKAWLAVGLFAAAIASASFGFLYLPVALAAVVTASVTTGAWGYPSRYWLSWCRFQ